MPGPVFRRPRFSCCVCPRGWPGAGSSSGHAGLIGSLPVIWAISFGDHIHSRAREALACPSGDGTRLAPVGLPSTRATRMTRLLTELWAALQPAAGYSLCSTRAGGFRVAVLPGRAAITAAAASQLAAMMDSAASGTATTGVMPS